MWIKMKESWKMGNKTQWNKVSKAKLNSLTITSEEWFSKLKREICGNCPEQ
jgi:hypothetical protein